MAVILLVRRRVVHSIILVLLVIEVFFLHSIKRYIFEEHVVHEFVPLYATIGISVNFHEQLVELLD